MKILFIYTDINVMSLGAKSYHFGIGILSAVLRQYGHKTALHYMYDKFRISPLIKKIKDFNPDVLAFTSDSTQFVYIKKILQIVKDFKIFTILGGPHTSLYPDCLIETDGLDAICRGEGEFALLELLDALENKKEIYHIKSLNFNNNAKVIENPTRPFISDLDSLPFSDREIFDYQEVINSDYGRASFMLSRGCPYDCAYCASPAMGKLQTGKYVRFMSVKQAISEIEYMKAKYRFKSIFFADDTFTIDRNFVYEFCQEYKRRINIPFEVNSRVESASLEMFKALKDAGCFKVHMGIESGDEDFRKDVLNREMSNQQIIDAFKWIKEAGLSTKSYNIVGFPYETAQIHQQTIDLNRKINPDGHVCYIFQPYPGTKLYEVCKNKGFIKNGNNKSIISRRDTVLNIPYFSPKEIVKCHRNFSFEVYKDKSFRRALIYKIYYSRYGEILLRIFAPIKNFLRNLVF